ncbi:hypothetical protein LOK49_LG06G01894 [Camellia lanceoleosa]|uniref:Uncharacterized protein n=1 Tax=Camellia lanceoleosa TaxID=1840588 RepID=A0ACC0HHX0_9ERIC|nr:hypothetical protein LOK49_LG06G01894 [Camellia lanceoleosa]
MEIAESSDRCSELNGADGSESLNTKRRKRVFMRTYDSGGGDQRPGGPQMARMLRHFHPNPKFESSDRFSELNGADGSESVNTKRRKRVFMRTYDSGGGGQRPGGPQMARMLRHFHPNPKFGELRPGRTQHRR